jgi:hypothetical protein
MIKKEERIVINTEQPLRITTQTKCTTITEFETSSIAICGDARCATFQGQQTVTGYRIQDTGHN